MLFRDRQNRQTLIAMVAIVVVYYGIVQSRGFLSSASSPSTPARRVKLEPNVQPIRITHQTTEDYAPRPERVLPNITKPPRPSASHVEAGLRERSRLVAHREKSTPAGFELTSLPTAGNREVSDDWETFLKLSKVTSEVFFPFSNSQGNPPEGQETNTTGREVPFERSADVDSSETSPELALTITGSLEASTNGKRGEWVEHRFPVDGQAKSRASPPPILESGSRDWQNGESLTEKVTPSGLPRQPPMNQFKLAMQPQIGQQASHRAPRADPLVTPLTADVSDFHPGPVFGYGYDPVEQLAVYETKHLNATQRPLLEIGRPWYERGQLSEPGTLLGLHNPIDQQFVVFGDSRVGVASNDLGGDSSTLVAVQTNLFFNWKLTGTERLAMFVSPTTRGLDNTRYLLDEDRGISELNFNIVNGFFEGDVGALWGGLANRTLPFDLPISIGIMPLVFQNGVWLEDNVLGFTATVPARNLPTWNIANLDVTFFAGYDNITSPAFQNDNHAARIYGWATFIEAWDGYAELDYAFLDDREDQFDRSYHNVGMGYTRRYGRWLSNSMRVIVNAGQDSAIGNTADGFLVLSENSLITTQPYSVVPYFNLFAGFDRPQSAARAVQSGGILRNSGILFESDLLTGYPTLDATANNTFGGALGVNLLPNEFSRQLVVESAALGVMKENASRVAPGPQYGIGMRYQQPLSNSVLLRADAMYGFLEDSQDLSGVRLELRKKF